ncbi:hypothetical protein KCP75_22755 [Salmonella enterica subsp. enterica]|nr:hypothetical protein KCP75_22755 [Salmonella enterica subsp. enterica]
MIKATGRRFLVKPTPPRCPALAPPMNIHECRWYFINALNSGGNSCWRYRVMAATARPAIKVSGVFQNPK